MKDPCLLQRMLQVVGHIVGALQQQHHLVRGGAARAAVLKKPDGVLENEGICRSAGSAHWISGRTLGALQESLGSAAPPRRSRAAEIWSTAGRDLEHVRTPS